MPLLFLTTILTELTWDIMIKKNNFMEDADGRICTYRMA